MSARQRMVERCRKAREQSDLPLPLLAEALAGELRKADPDLLREWMDESLEQFIYDLLDEVGRQARATARDRAKSGRLEQYVEEYLLDAEDRMADGTRKRHRDMLKADTLFLSRHRKTQGQELLLEASFWEAVAKRQGRKTVGEAFSETALAELYRAVTGSEAA